MLISVRASFRDRRWRRRVGVLLWLLLAAPGATASADVVVVANRTRQTVVFQVVPERGKSRELRVASSDVITIPLRGPCELMYDMSRKLVRYRLDANSAYFFVQNENGWLDLRKIDLAGDQNTFGGRALGDESPQTAVRAIPIKILVDNHEPTTRAVWEARLRKRIHAVSDILEKHCQVRLKIVAVDQWTSGGKSLNFQQAYHEFQHVVDPQPGQLAIGFTGRFRNDVRRLHLGTIQGLLRRHILVREWSEKMSEPERVEVLLHEVGHYLGAVHSPSPRSVMRPILADNQAIEQAFRIGFDPVNTLLINLVGEEIRHRGVFSVDALSPGTRRRLSQIYGTLAKAAPNDKSAKQYQFQLGMVGGSPLARATREIVSAVRRAATARSPTPAGPPSAAHGDQLTEYYVRGAAAAAAALPEDVAPPALLLGLGIALDRSGTLQGNPLTREFSARVESPAERQERRAALGAPTLRGRRDLAQHFFLSAYLTVIVGATAAESAGMVKELADAKSGSGFSYADLAADVAGITFAERIVRRELTLDSVARGFQCKYVMPEVADLPEGLRWRELAPQLARKEKPSMTSYRREIQRRIEGLPAIHPAGGAK